jgi:hypothetical protein
MAQIRRATIARAKACCTATTSDAGCLAGVAPLSTLPAPRWSRPRRTVTVADLLQILHDVGRCADIFSACRVGGSTSVRWHQSTTVVGIGGGRGRLRRTLPGGRGGLIRSGSGRGRGRRCGVVPRSIRSIRYGRSGRVCRGRPGWWRGSDRRWSKHSHRGWSNSRRDTPTRGRRIDHRLADSGADRPTSLPNPREIGHRQCVDFGGQPSLLHRNQRRTPGCLAGATVVPTTSPSKSRSQEASVRGPSLGGKAPGTPPLSGRSWRRSVPPTARRGR